MSELVGRVEDTHGWTTTVRRRPDGTFIIYSPPTAVHDAASLAALRELLDRAAMPGQPAATGALDPAKRPATPDEPVSPSCNYEVVFDTRGQTVDVGADLGEVELDRHKLTLDAARELLAGLAASIRHCEWWLAENAPGEDAAMPGQPATGAEAADAAEAREPLPRKAVLGDMTDYHGRRGHIGVDHAAVVVYGLELPLSEARKARELIGQGIADRELWLAQNPEAAEGEPRDA